MPLIPINTDAPLYHFPYATIGLIVVNTVCFVATGFGMNDRLQEPWLLQYGDGLNPLEWIPAAFAHGGFMHLIGNMFFLWGFGLVVEGKLGWRIFIPLYLGMAAAWGAGVDLLTLHRTDPVDIWTLPAFGNGRPPLPAGATLRYRSFPVNVKGAAP